MAENIVYVATDKETGNVVLGARGQSGFTSKAALNKSIAQSYRTGYASRVISTGKKASDFYDIVAIDVGELNG